MTASDTRGRYAKSVTEAIASARVVHFAHRGSSQVPPRTWATVPQPLQGTHRSRPRLHQASPVTREISHTAVRPQMPHCVAVLGRQLAQRGMLVGFTS
jgi:hypothetical protein